MLILMGLLGCKQKKDKTEYTPVDTFIETNANVLENTRLATAKGNDDQAVTNWFPESILGYKLDKDKKDIGEGAKSCGPGLSIGIQKIRNRIFLLRYGMEMDAATFTVKNRIALNLSDTGEESTTQMRRKVYERKGRTSAGREVYESGQVNIAFEVDGRFYNSKKW